MKIMTTSALATAIILIGVTLLVLGSIPTKNTIEGNTLTLRETDLVLRGLTIDKAKELLIMGFIDRFREELPMEYAVELNALLKNYF